MAAMNFPDNPTTNQEYTNDVGRVWVWTGSTWTSKTVNLDAYIADTTNVHGIANTATLAYQSDLTSKQNVVANVSDTEIGYLANVTSDIQGQLDAKANSSHTHVIGDISNSSITVTELNYLDGVTSNVQSQIDGKANTSHSHVIGDISNVTVSVEELNYLDGVTSNVQSQLDSKAATSHSHTISDISNSTITVTELNYLDGVTSNVQAQIDGKANTSHSHSISDISNVTASTAELNILDGATIDVTELNYLDGVTSNVQSQLDGKASSTHSHIISDISNVTVDVAELNYLDGVTSNVQAQLDGKASSSHTHSVSDISNVTASASELNILDGATLSTTELNYLDGATSNVQAQIDGKLSLSGGTMTGKITLDGDPTQANHAANKAYVDSISEGLHIHQSVVAATTANINLATDLENGDVLDNVTLVTGNRVLVKNQTTQSQNGIYIVQASGAAVRASDFDSPTEVDGGDFVFVNQGTVNGDTGWVQVSDSIVTIGTDPIIFTQFSGAGTIQAGNNISVNGYVVSTVSNPSFANVTVSSNLVLSNATVTGLSIDQLNDVAISNAASGDVVYWDGDDWVNKYVNAIPAKTAVPTITSNNYTLTSGDEGMILEISSNNATTVTIPTSETFANGTQMIIMQTGTGAVSIIAQNTSTQTLNYDPGNILRAQWSAATLLKRNTNTWVLYGDLTA